EGDVAHDDWSNGQAGDRSRRDALVRGTGSARPRRSARARLVHAQSPRRAASGLTMVMRALFHDRAGAGRQLAEDLVRYKGRHDVFVLGLARGGVPVAYEVARALGAPLEVLAVRT